MEEGIGAKPQGSPAEARQETEPETRSLLEQRKTQFLQKGMIDRVKYLETLENKFLPSVVKRMAQNDKTVLFETVVPKWMEWELLHEWAKTRVNGAKK